MNNLEKIFNEALDEAVDELLDEIINKCRLKDDRETATINTIENEEIKSSISVLSGLLGYSERLGLVSDINTKDCRECYAKEYRTSYENALKTAIKVLIEKLNAC